MRLFGFSKFRGLLFIVCVLLVTSLVISKVSAATEAELKVPDIEYYPITEHQTWLNFTFFLEETGRDFATNVKLLAGDLKDPKRGLIISGNEINMTVDGVDATQWFELTKGGTEQITVSIKTKDAKPGTYQGIIKVDADNATNVELEVKIQVSQPFYYAALFNLIGILAGVVGTIFGVQQSLTKGRQVDQFIALVKKYGVPIFIGCFIVAILFLSSLLALHPTVTDFGADGVVDYITAFFFGLGQYAAGTVPATIVKIRQDIKRARSESNPKT